MFILGHVNFYKTIIPLFETDDVEVCFKNMLGIHTAGKEGITNIWEEKSEQTG